MQTATTTNQQLANGVGQFAAALQQVVTTNMQMQESISTTQQRDSKIINFVMERAITNAFGTNASPLGAPSMFTPMNGGSSAGAVQPQSNAVDSSATGLSGNGFNGVAAPPPPNVPSPLAPPTGAPNGLLPNAIVSVANPAVAVAAGQHATTGAQAAPGGTNNAQVHVAGGRYVWQPELGK